MTHNLDTLDSERPLAIQLIGIPLMALLLTILQTLALVVLQHAVLTAVMTAAEPAVADNRLCTVFAILERAADLLGRHSTAKWQCHVQSRVRGDGVFGKGGR